MVFKRIFAKLKYKPDSQPEEARAPYYYSGGTLVTPDTAMEVSAFYRGTIYIATQTAKLPWEIKTKENFLVEDDLTELLDVAPNPEMNSFFFRIWNIIQAIQHGNAYSEIERSVTGKPIALWPIEHGACSPVRSPDGKLYYKLNGTVTASGHDTLLEPRDIFNLMNFHTHDGIVGQGIIAYARDTLGIAKGADSFANSLYANSGMPSGILSVPGRLSSEAWDRLKDSWDKAHARRKTGGTAVLEDGATYSPVSFSPEVLQFLESRKFSVVEIARFLGVPPQKLYDSESSTYNNIEHANLEVVTDTLDAWARNFEMETRVKLLKNNRHTIAKKSELDLRAVFRGDMDTRSNYFTRRLQTASITPNQIRKMEGDAPYTGGDEYYIAANNYSPISRMDEIIDANIKSKDTTDTESKSKEEKELTEAAKNYLLKTSN